MRDRRTNVPVARCCESACGRTRRRAEEWYSNAGIEPVADPRTGRIMNTKIAPTTTLRAHSGVEPPPPGVPKAPEPLVAAAGRLVAYKGIDLLLRLWEPVRPITGFGFPCARDSIEDGVTGVLVCGKSSLAAEWCTFALSRKRRAALGQAALQRAERCGWNATVRAFREAAAEAVGVAAAGEAGR